MEKYLVVEPTDHNHVARFIEYKVRIDGLWEVLDVVEFNTVNLSFAEICEVRGYDDMAVAEKYNGNQLVADLTTAEILEISFATKRKCA